MRILIVERSLVEVDAFCERLERDVFPKLEQEVVVSVTTADRLTRNVTAIEAVVIGPGVPPATLDGVIQTVAHELPSAALLIITAGVKSSGKALDADPRRTFIPLSSLERDLPRALSERSPDATPDVMPPENLPAVPNRYKILKTLGGGSIGMTYLAQHREVNTQVVMKVVWPGLSDSEKCKSRVLAGFEVRHPNVAMTYEYFRTDKAQAYTTEYADGGNLGVRMAAREPLSLSEILRLLRELASGLGAIHAADILHAALSPENVLLTASGTVKITDFGFIRHGSGPKLTEHGSVVGTIDQISPEYLERSCVDTRSDIFAVGTLAYKMITGVFPHQGRNLIESLALRLKVDAPPPSERRAGCPAALDAVVLKMLSRNPDQRYQNGRELLTALEGCTAS